MLDGLAGEVSAIDSFLIINFGLVCKTCFG